MMLDFRKEVTAILEALGLDPEATHSREKLQIAMVIATAFDKGMAQERRRCLDIVARKAMNAAEVRAEIERPVR